MCPNCPIALKKDFWGNWPMLPLSAFVYLSPIMLKCFKKNLYNRSWDIKLNNFGPNWVLIVLLPEKEILWENWVILMSTYPAPLYYNGAGQVDSSISIWQCLKKILTVEQIMRYKVSQFLAKLGPNCPFPLKRDFNWLILILFT